jgi:hypothetical protein
MSISIWWVGAMITKCLRSVCGGIRYSVDRINEKGSQNSVSKEIRRAKA